MPTDPAKLPGELVPYADALEFRSARPHADLGCQAYDWSASMVPLIPVVVEGLNIGFILTRKVWRGAGENKLVLLGPSTSYVLARVLPR